MPKYEPTLPKEIRLELSSRIVALSKTNYALFIEQVKAKNPKIVTAYDGIKPSKVVENFDLIDEILESIECKNINNGNI